MVLSLLDVLGAWSSQWSVDWWRDRLDDFRPREEEEERCTCTCRKVPWWDSSVRKAGAPSRRKEDFLETEGEGASLTTLSTREADTGSTSSSLSLSLSSTTVCPFNPFCPF